MEFTFSELRAKEVINTQDGRRLGKVCDISLCYPENRWIGLVVPGGKSFGKKNNLFIELRNIVKIGEDVILVNVGMPRKTCGKDKGGVCKPTPPPPHGFENRNFEECE
jgi:YlmC/YmxH family sporulation protein